MTGCKKIDMDTWARREHYEYYTKQLKVEYNITANVDVKNILDFCHSKGYKFYPAMIYLVTKTLNGYGSRVSTGEPSFFPIVLMGKYQQHGKKILMPVNITIAHAVADGYHVGLFFQYLQEEINNY